MKQMRLIFNTLFALLLMSHFATAAIRVGLVLDRGGREDKSFNSAAFAGSTRAQKELGIELKVVEPTDNNSYDLLLRSLAQKKYDLIIAVGFTQKEALQKIATQYPDMHFASVDSEVSLPNVRSLMFEEHEGSYLVGAIAALTSKTGKIGFIGGMDIPLIRRFEMGYIAGVKKINPKANITSNFIGVTGEAWNNPAKGKELALAQYGSGIDVIFTASGASNMGIFDAAEEKKLKAIGVDSNQNWIKPGTILTSMLKRVDDAVFKTIQTANDGKYQAGVIHHGLKDKGVDYALDQYNDKLIPTDVRKKVEELRSQIIAGKIDVPDYYKKSKK